MRFATCCTAFAFAGAALSSLAAQVPPRLALDREEYARWLATAPTSPFGALALQRIGNGVTVGDGGEVPVEGLPVQRVEQRGGVVRMSSTAGTRALGIGLPARIQGFALVATGLPERRMIAVFGPRRALPAPTYFPYQSRLVDTVTLQPPATRGSVTLLGSDGIEVVATEAGRVAVVIMGTPTTLTVRRLPGASPDETELEIYFRDATNGRGSYSAGRFVTLEPTRDGRYVLDFNRSRNPFCAYSSVFPCPAPWPGNSIAAEVSAGERADKAEGADGADKAGKTEK